MFYDATTRKLAEEVASQPGDLFHELGTLAYFSMKFSPDIKHQMIRTPQRALKDGVANCVDYTVFIGSVAHALGLPVVVRIARFKHDEGFSHVYPIVDGVVMDMCIGQDSGHRSYPHIGMEVTSIETKDFFIN